MMDTPFQNLSKKVKEIEVDGDTIYVKPKVKDVESFITMDEKMNDKDAEKLTNSFVNMIERAYKQKEIETTREDIEDYVAEHYGSIMYKIMELFGFASKDKIDDLKKKATEKMGAKAQ